MTKELSKQLCELCGAEPLKLSDCSFKNLTEVGYEIGTDYCPSVEDETITCKKCEYSKITHYTYPDFSKPDNFVKLLELPINVEDEFNTVGEWLWRMDETYICRQSFITKLIYLIRYKFFGYEYIQQALKNTEWSY